MIEKLAPARSTTEDAPIRPYPLLLAVAGRVHGNLGNDCGERPTNARSAGKEIATYFDRRPDGVPELTQRILQGQADPGLVGGVIKASLASDNGLTEVVVPVLEGLNRDERPELIRTAHTQQTSSSTEHYYIGTSSLDRLVPALVQLGHSEEEVRTALKND